MTELNQGGVRRMTKARAQIIHTNDFYGPLLIRWPCVAVPKEQAKARAWTDFRKIYYDTEWAAKMPVTALKGVIVHELMHNIYLHEPRIKKLPGFFPKLEPEKMTEDQIKSRMKVMEKANRAADYTINGHVLSDGFELPEDCLHGEYSGYMEDIYRRLPDPPENPGGGGGGGGGGWGQVIPDDKPTSEAEEQAQIREVQGAVQAAAHAAKSRGTLPGHIEQLLDEWAESSVDWRNELWQFDSVYGGIRTRTSWRKPNRRYIAHGMYLPKRMKFGPKCIVVALDTSGSVSDKELQVLMGEMNGIHQAVGPKELIVIQCDAKIQDVTIFKPNDIIDPGSYKPLGRGGTTFDLPFDYVRDEVLSRGVVPDYFVYGTDGECPFPGEPDYPVIWAMTTGVKAPWGKTIHVEID